MEHCGLSNYCIFLHIKLNKGKLIEVCALLDYSQLLELSSCFVFVAADQFIYIFYSDINIDHFVPAFTLFVVYYTALCSVYWFYFYCFSAFTVRKL